jgi:1-acyl-sn-glycerol-3-phosphate acyltransferase
MDPKVCRIDSIPVLASGKLDEKCQDRAFETNNFMIGKFSIPLPIAQPRCHELLFGYSSRIYVVGCEHINRAGGFCSPQIISHFDPPIISSVARRKIDWMAMAEFFPVPGLGHFLRAVDAFPAARDRADRKTIRSAIKRLKDGRIVGVFPEGGIRDGACSLLEGAPLRAGASTLAHMAGVPIVPCVILGSDRLWKRWMPLANTGLDRFRPGNLAFSGWKSVARARIEQNSPMHSSDSTPSCAVQRATFAAPAAGGCAANRKSSSPTPSRQVRPIAVDLAMCVDELLQSRHPLEWTQRGH